MQALRSVIAFGEVKGEGGLVSSKIVDMEDEFFRQILFAPPDDPPNSCIDKSILVATNIDALHQRQAEIPLKLWVKKWCNESTARRIHVDWSFPPTNKMQHF